MPLAVEEVPFMIHEPVVLDFMEHCFYYWRDTVRCSDANVLFMKHLVRFVFGLPQTMQLVGIRFNDGALVMLHPPDFHTFFVLERRDEWRAKRVNVEVGALVYSSCILHADIVVGQGYVAQWGMETGFWDGLDMAEAVLIGNECVGPSEDV